MAMQPTPVGSNEPSISIRRHIKWGDDPASEPTSTLVLTSSRRYFVDVRILKPVSEEEEEPPNRGGPQSRIDWAFAGTSKSTLYPPAAPPQPAQEPSDPSTPAPTTSPPAPAKRPACHSTWTHYVDSTTTGPLVDEGDMYPLPSGLVLETGAMRNPATGLVTPYEELWYDDGVLAVSDAAGPGAPKRWSVVLVLEGKDGAKGVVVRVGQWVQCVLRVGGGVGTEVERWRWEGGKGKWEREVKIGGMLLPCAACFAPEVLGEEGKTVTYGEFTWVVREVFSW